MIKQAIYVPNFGAWGSPGLLVDLALDAEKAGFDGLFLWDHINISSKEGVETVDPSVALGAIAQVTSRIKIGPVVTPIARRRPWKLARELVTLDVLSDGRLIFGAGLGEPPELEFSAFGENSSGKVRAGKLDEGLVVLDRLTRGQETNFRGEHYQIQDVQFRPVSIQNPRFPIWIAATLPGMAGVSRSLGWDGIFPVVRPDTSMVGENFKWSHWFPTLVDFKKVVDTVKKRRTADTSFDFIASGLLGEKDCKGSSIDDYAKAGATWWLHWIDDSFDSYSETVRKIKAGPVA